MKRTAVFFLFRPPRKGCRKNGVTLIELLVAVATVAVLAGFLFPSLTRMRNTSEKTTCTSNLRQLGVGIQAYAADNNGHLPPGYQAGAGTFEEFVSPYVAPMKTKVMSADVFYCPTNVRLGSPPAAGFPSTKAKGWAGYYMGYEINASIHVIPQLGEAPFVRLSSVKIPAKTVSLLDMFTRAPSVGAPPTAGYYNGNYFNPKSSSFGLGRPHGGTGNILFVDGHVESFDGSVPLPVNSLPDRETPFF